MWIDPVQPLTLSDRSDLDQIKQLALAGLTSKHTVRAYETALDRFLGWYDRAGRPALRKHVVEAYKAHLIEQGLAPATTNRHLAAIRRLVREAADNGLIDSVQAESVARVKGVKRHGRRLGNWLSEDQAQALLDAPSTATLRGLRDQAILAVLLGAGLRRSELVALQYNQLQQRDGRWMILDIHGKHGRIRSVPLSSWAYVAVDQWRQAANLDGGHVFRSMRKGDRLDASPMSGEAILAIVTEYTEAIGLQDIAAHDLRRTFAQLAWAGGAPIEQIQLSLGHASIATTEAYLGIKQDLQDAPADRVHLKVRKRQ